MLAAVLAWALTIYAAAGAIFALGFVIRGVTRIDAHAEGAGLAFRLLIFPGSAALWPVLLTRWLGVQS